MDEHRFVVTDGVWARLDRHVYKWRHLVENFFAKIKAFRAIATRYEKTASSYIANWRLAATIIAAK